MAPQYVAIRVCDDQFVLLQVKPTRLPAAQHKIGQRRRGSQQECGANPGKVLGQGMFFLSRIVRPDEI